MDIQTKASLTVSAKLSMDEISAAIIAAAAAEAKLDQSASLQAVSSSVAFNGDGTATVALVYEKSEAAPIPPGSAPAAADPAPAMVATPAAAVDVAPAVPVVSLVPAA